MNHNNNNNNNKMKRIPLGLSIAIDLYFYSIQLSAFLAFLLKHFSSFYLCFSFIHRETLENHIWTYNSRKHKLKIIEILANLLPVILILFPIEIKTQPFCFILIYLFFFGQIFPFINNSNFCGGSLSLFLWILFVK